MRALEFIRDHVTFKLPYDFSYHMKNPFIYLTYIYYLNNQMTDSTLVMECVIQGPILYLVFCPRMHPILIALKKNIAEIS